MTEPAPKVGERLTTGLLFRRVPNTDLQWDYKGGGPTKLAFRPDKGEDGISTFLTHLTTEKEVLLGHPGYGLCTIDIPRFLEEIERLKADPKIRFREDVAITYTPSHEDGPAHCYIAPVPGLIQKALRRVAVAKEPPSTAVEGKTSAQDAGEDIRL
ncbi:MAG: hypothetical protein ACREJ6_08780 [Candidatus Methylomirabilis sp.]